ACSSDDSASDNGTTSKSTTTTEAERPLTILVSNDDGIGAPGLDALVEGLRKVPNTKVIVSAPVANQSGTGGKTTPGGTPAATDATTASGVGGHAVPGF